MLLKVITYEVANLILVVYYDINKINQHTSHALVFRFDVVSWSLYDLNE